jgi:hypothetical protein
VQTIIFWIRHHHIDNEIYMLEQESVNEPVAALDNKEEAV